MSPFKKPKREGVFMAGQVQPNAALPVAAAQNEAQNNAEAQGKLQQRKVTELRNHYLSKQKEAEFPWKALVNGICLIAAVAAAIFASASLAWFPAVLIGFGMMTILNGIGDAIVKRLVDQKYKNAADAIMAPGFYEFANQNPKQLANAATISESYNRFIAVQA